MEGMSAPGSVAATSEQLASSWRLGSWKIKGRARLRYLEYAPRRKRRRETPSAVLERARSRLQRLKPIALYKPKRFFQGFPASRFARYPFCPQSVSHRSHSLRGKWAMLFKQTIGGPDMRLFLACAIIIASAVGMAGCFHHQQAVEATPLKLG